MRGLIESVRQSASKGYLQPVPDAGSDEIAELAKAFNTAGKEIQSKVSSLQEREESLRNYLANTTHDVMTPLTVLQGHLIELQAILQQGTLGRPAHNQAGDLRDALPDLSDPQPQCRRAS